MVCARVQTSYNDLIALPRAMADSLQLRLWLAGENSAHRIERVFCYRCSIFALFLEASGVFRRWL
jgi:hypothetical protein